MILTAGRERLLAKWRVALFEAARVAPPLSMPPAPLSVPDAALTAAHEPKSGTVPLPQGVVFFFGGQPIVGGQAAGLLRPRS